MVASRSRSRYNSIGENACRPPIQQPRFGVDPCINGWKRHARWIESASDEEMGRTRNVGYRAGIGDDLHRLTEGRPLILGGVRVPFERGLLGHSDADVVLHAVTDALLGAAALGDIGEHFPDVDPRWKGADSAVLLVAALERVRERGCEPVNCDVVIHAQQPKLGPWKVQIRDNLARLLGLPQDAVNVKAKTEEHVGPVGRGEAISALAIVLCRLAEGNEGSRTMEFGP